VFLRNLAANCKYLSKYYNNLPKQNNSRKE
jgi:hypothetical protein